MKYTVSIEIELPRETVAQLLAEPAHRPQWQRGLVRKPILGGQGQVGAHSWVVLRIGDQEFEGLETVTEREPAALHYIPQDVVARLEREIAGKGIRIAARERLTVAGPGRTLWESENEYRFSGLRMRLRGLLMQDAFRKQSLQQMRDFKAFAEHGKDVRD